MSIENEYSSSNYSSNGAMTSTPSYTTSNMVWSTHEYFDNQVESVSRCISSQTNSTFKINPPPQVSANGSM